MDDLWVVGGIVVFLLLLRLSIDPEDLNDPDVNPTGCFTGSWEDEGGL
jgi:hypothetical protein